MKKRYIFTILKKSEFLVSVNFCICGAVHIISPFSFTVLVSISRLDSVRDIVLVLPVERFFMFQRFAAK